MSCSSKQRRATKQPRKQRRASDHTGGDRSGGGSANRPGSPGVSGATCDCPLCRADARPAASQSRTDAEQFAAAELLLPDLIGQAWQRGWQPREVARQIARSVSPKRPACQLVALAIAREAAQFAAASGAGAGHPIDVRWTAQVASITRRLPTDPERAGWVARWAEVVGADTAIAVYAAVSRELTMLGPLLVLIAPPGSSAETVAQWSDLVGWAVDATDTTDPLLGKVRALLAKAEATDFVEEAESFTAKAHQLMVSHAIEEAAVRGRDAATSSADVGATRFSLPEPYARQHALLLSEVAESAGARCVLHPDWALATVVGSRPALAQVDTLFTSLMVQSQSAFNAVAVHADAGSRERSRGFRSSFLTAYARRIGHRLREQRDMACRAAPGDALPVLAADRVAVDERCETLFGGSLRPMSVSASDAFGWIAGSEAATRARLSSDELRTEPVRRLST